MVSTTSTFLLIPLALAVNILFVLRLILKRSKNHQLKEVYRTLKTFHAKLALVLIAMSFLHALTSSTGLFVLNYGSLALLCMLLACESFHLRKLLKHWWILMHRLFSGLFVIMTAIHIIINVQ
jgi:ABC-type multidrug transport system permease subunit